MQKRLAGFFISSAFVILAATGAAKIFSAITGGDVLQAFDPVFGISLRRLFVVVGGIEIVVALVCLLGQRTGFQAGLLLWLAVSFVVYRLGLLLLGNPKFCGCLGTLTGALHISPQVADFAMKVISVYLLLGSCATLFWHSRMEHKAERSQKQPTAGIQ
jgi:hypothetical protein